METDNPRRLTITLDFPAPGNQELNPLARRALNELLRTAKTPEDMTDTVLMEGTQDEVRVYVEHTWLKADGDGKLMPDPD